VTVTLRHRPPYDWASILAFLAARALDGVEHVDGRRYRRTFSHDGVTGSVAVVHVAEDDCLSATIVTSNARIAPAIVARVRRVFDLDREPTAFRARFAADPRIGPMVRSRPGLRIPGGWDGFELGVRAVLGQQVTVEAGRRLGSRLAALAGRRFPADDDGPTLVFPGAAEVVAADLSTLGMPDSRRRTLKALAAAAVADPRLFEAAGALDETLARLTAIHGIGDWTAHYIALRAAREEDAFPASDIGLLRGAAVDGKRPSPVELRALAEKWRPFRAYAAQQLWAEDAARIV
jgi:AraC family transcriptional regulator of adaptative response / DNA-3-methyladenine glycosylase II